MKKKKADLLQEYQLETGADNPILRTNCDEVTEFWLELRQLSQDMRKLMRIHYWTWLAAPQIGITIRLITTIQRKEKKGNLHEIGETVMVNPIIIEQSEEYISSQESCLSLPHLEGVIKRHKKITVEYQDIYGQKKTKKFVWYNATVIQHEIDHINGILFVDHIITKSSPKK